ncbi:hypothetical protein AGABI1DRAFT_115067 [Agaricus bisporus var. burnettii JB137-S8]|uniref:FAD-binding domain-containing protein n=1 Tax=Agaricus bisporus var. burnettii (strain JB137-S8 / ATCC MYA-4627 / FGSC 10392) TaxID=597362 RepID=K5X4G5_AGABU|nr:uncharacterized protein AGABI1DRAFT_115067 [Agaricus bisporus var. burnettii JB137-S8]EKM77827.1 hypothetical protein AGABI1DRAFT_115067 [Agaricus bisporus var. burnettii JB137-S8]
MVQGERSHIAIIGAGIVGLAFAVALNALDKEHKFAIDLYEATPELAEIGAGINVWPLTLSILKEMGLHQTLIPFFDHYPDLERRVIFGLRKADEKNGFHVYDVMNEGGALRIHRADLQRGLIQHLPLSKSNKVHINTPCTFHLNHRLKDYTRDASEDFGRIKLHFDKKPSRECDVLIGADGIHSTVRQLFLSRLPSPERYDKYRKPVWSGLVAYRGLVSREDLEETYPGHRALTHPGLIYTGKTRYVTIYPVSGGKFINVVAIARDTSNDTGVWKGPWKVEVTQEEFFHTYQGFDEEVLALIHCIKKPTKWALHVLDHLDIFSKQQVFLMGDAAHAMLPHLGAGATVGIEDAYILASMLTHQSTSRPLNSEKIKLISTIYNTVLVPHATRMSKLTNDTGHLLDLTAPGFDLEHYTLGDRIPLETLINAFRQVERNWIWSSSDPEEDRRKVEDLLESWSGPRLSISHQ